MDNLEILSTDHWVDSYDGHTLHLQELLDPTTSNDNAILFLPGVFTNSRFFFNRKQQGAARYFHEQGYRVFMGNLRGHGLSQWPPQVKQKWDWSFDTYVEHDVPNLLQFVFEQHNGPIYVVAHSFAGYTLLAALGLKPELQDRLSGIILLGSAVNDYSDGGLSKRLQLPLASMISQLYGRMPGKRFKLGPDDEPKALMHQFAHWAKNGHFSSLDGKRDYWQSLAAVTLPIYAAIGSKDIYHASPARAEKLIKHLSTNDVTFRVFGQDQGDTSDFSHYDIASGLSANAVIFPIIDAWIKERAA